MKSRLDSISKNNKGLSLVELIVVVAIMAVMIGAGGYTLSMLSSAEARQAVQKFNAQLNDVKTGTMTKAGEVFILRYIDVTKDERAKEGIDKAGYYADKCVYTILNNAPGNSIKTAYTDKHDYAYVGAKKVEITFEYTGGTYKLDGTNNTAVKIEFNRQTGALEKITTGSMSGDVFTPAGEKLGDINKVTFKCGLRTYTLNVTAKTGKYSIES